MHSSFKSRPVKLALHIFLMSVRQLYSKFLVNFCDALQFMETETAESASCVLSCVQKHNKARLRNKHKKEKEELDLYVH